MKTIMLILVLLALPLAAQDRVITSAEVAQGWFDVTIAGGESLSSSVGIGKACTPVALRMPDTWTTANITFLASPNSSAPVSLYDDGTEVTATAAASRYITLDAAVFFTVRVLQLRSGTAASAVNQAASRTIRVVCR